MRLLKGEYYNFASYSNLAFDYSNLGLTLISGPTGAGKSTLMDAALWCLYGVTSKEGSVDDVKSWNAEEMTAGFQYVELNGRTIFIVRTRGKPSQNDLYWTELENPGNKIRGKDVTETQKMLEDRLGCSADLFLSGAYLHQFSKADTFFISKAKDRREVFERIADLSLPIKLGENVSNVRKSTKLELDKIIQQRSKLRGMLDGVINVRGHAFSRSIIWKNEHDNLLQTYKNNSETFEEDRNKKLEGLTQTLEALDKEIKPNSHFKALLEENETAKKNLDNSRELLNEAVSVRSSIDTKLTIVNQEYTRFSKPTAATCPHCLGSTDNENIKKHLKVLAEQKKILVEAAKYAESGTSEEAAKVDYWKKASDKLKDIQVAQEHNRSLKHRFELVSQEFVNVNDSDNTYLADLEREEAASNPYAAQLEQVEKDIYSIGTQMTEVSANIKLLEHKIISLTQLYDLSMDLRGALLQNSVHSIEGSTNHYLEKYFDGEIRVSLPLVSDKLEVNIQKSGNDCNFKQLSGGQRCLLKLAFSLSLMKAASDKAGIHFGTLMLDEPLHALDGDLKIKAFSLLQELALDHESVIVVEHSEDFKNLFDNRYIVSMESDCSTIEKVENAEG